MEGIIKDEYKDYSFSKLTELLTLNDTKLLEISPSMTVKEIRDFKKQLKESDEIPTSEIKEKKETKTDDDIIDVPTNDTTNIDDHIIIINNTLESLSAMFKIDFNKPSIENTNDNYITFAEGSYIHNIKEIDKLDSKYSYELFATLPDEILNKCYYVTLDKFVGLLYIKDIKGLLIKDINIINLNEVHKNKFLESTGSSFQQVEFDFGGVLNG